MAIITKNIFNFYITVAGAEIDPAQLQLINTKLDNIMASNAELNQKVDALQVALDAEQEQIAAAIAALQTTVEELKVLVADGGTAEERQAIADKLDAITADLQATIADTPEEPGA